MPAAVRAASSAAVDTGNITVTKPAGTVDGDLLIAVCFADPDGAAVTAPGGWTQVGSTFAPSGTGFGAVYRKTAAGEGTSYVFPGSSGSSNSVMLLAVTGHDPATPVDVAATWGNGASSTSHVAPSVSPAGADSLLVCGWYVLAQGLTATYTPPGDMTERVDVQPAGKWIGSSVATRALTVAGATGTKTATCTASRQFIGVSLAVKSATGGGQAVVPAGVTVPVAVGSPSGAWSGAAGPDGLAVPVAAGAPSGAVQSSTTPGGVPVAVTAGSPAVSWTAVAGPGGVAVPVTVGAPLAGAAGVVPDGVTVPVVLGVPTVDGEVTITPDGIPVPVVVGAPVIGAAAVAPDGLAVPVAVGGVSLAWSAAVGADGVAVSVAAGSPGVFVPGAVAHRPFAGVVQRPSSGIVVRPDTGEVSRP